MKQQTVAQRTWKSAIGVATAASTIVAGLAPAVQAAPAAPQRDNTLRQHAADAVDGTYESCGAYFGFGKNEFGVLDIVEFDVSDQNGSDGAAHAVGTDTQVVLELRNDGGDTIECTPVEVTEQMWDDALSTGPIGYLDTSVDHPLPAWPGPGHYIYPSVNFGPFIEGFGQVEAVGYKVTSIPTGHTLVSPTAVKPLATHYPAGTDDVSNVRDPLVSAYVTSAAGPAVASALATGLAACGPDGNGDADFNTDLVEAIDALRAYQGYSPGTDYGCFDLMNENALVSFLLGFSGTVSYTEPIVLSLPTAPTSTASPSTEQPSTATPATPVAAQPTYTG